MRPRLAAAVAGSALALAVALAALARGPSRSGGAEDPPPGERGAEASGPLLRLRARPSARGPAGDPRHSPDLRLVPLLEGQADAADRRALASRSPVARALSSWSAEELALVAEFERLTGRQAPESLRELVERRRARAGAEELRATATRLFAGDPLGRAAALGWLRANPR